MPPGGGYLLQPMKRRYTKLEGRVARLIEPCKGLPTNIKILKPPKAGPLALNPNPFRIRKGKYFIEDTDLPGTYLVISHYKLLRYYFGRKPRRRMTKAQIAALAKTAKSGPSSFVGLPIRQDLEVIPDPTNKDHGWKWKLNPKIG